MPDPHILALVGLIFLLAGAVKGVIGVGLPTVAVGLMTAFIGLHEAVQVVVVPALITNIWQGAVGGHFKALSRRLWPLLAAACIGTWFGAALLVVVAANWLSGGLGVLLAVYSLYSLTMPQVPPPGRWEPLLSPVMGLLAGVAMGAVASFTMPGAVYLQALRLPRDELVQAMGIAFTVVTAAQAAALGGHGVLTQGMAATSALALVPAAMGMVAGQKLRHRFSPATFRRLFFVGLLLLGGYLTLRAFA